MPYASCSNGNIHASHSCYHVGARKRPFTIYLVLGGGLLKARRQFIGTRGGLLGGNYLGSDGTLRLLGVPLADIDVEAVVPGAEVPAFLRRLRTGRAAPLAAAPFVVGLPFATASRPRLTPAAQNQPTVTRLVLV